MVRLSAFLLLFTAIAPLIAAPNASHRMPDALFSTYEGKRYPLFVAASAAFGADGAPTLLLPEGWRQEHNRTRQLGAAVRSQHVSAMAVGSDNSTPAPCEGVRLPEPDVESMVIRDTIGTTIDHATAIFVGTIAEITPGLFHGHPASMLRLNEITVLKTSGGYKNVTDTLFARYPFAKFSAGGMQYCAGIESPEPAVGYRVMIFAFGPPLDEAGLFVYSFRNDVLLQGVDGLEYPPLLEVFRSSGARDLDEVAAFIRRYLRREVQ